MMTTTTEILRSRQAAERAAAWECYRKLLARNASPQKGDAEQLAKVQAALDLSDTDVEQHAAAVAEATRLVELIPRRAELETEIAKLNEKLVAERIVAARAQLVLEKTFAEWNAAGGTLVTLKTELFKLTGLKRKYPQLLADVQETP